MISPTASSPSPRTKQSTKSARGSGLKAQWPPATTSGSVAPRSRADRQPGEVEEVEDVGVDELRREVEGQDVEARGGEVVLEGEEGDAGLAHGRLHVDPGGVRALGERIVALVQDLVEDLEALVRQADLVGVRVEEQPGDRAGSVLGGLRSELAADVAGRFRNLREERLDLWPE